MLQAIVLNRDHMHDIVPYISKVVNVGGIAIGGSEAVRIQSMTNTSTLDAEATTRQAMELFDAGCEMVRMTVRNMKEAGKLSAIRTSLENKGYFQPLVADIHFNPKVAEAAAAVVHKIRINPGNYIDRQFYLSLERDSVKEMPSSDEIREGISRLTGICKSHRTAIRVGVNHGSLSERILMQYGNTSRGMVASAIEFLEICREMDFHDLLVSMKSSHVPTMINANLELVREMQHLNMDFPIHLGVTEAGEGEDGRIRSAAGIGPLLAMGIGDTIRVSLTENPVAEIPVARKLRDAYPKHLKESRFRNHEIRRGADGKIVRAYNAEDKERLVLHAAADISLLIQKGYGSEYELQDNRGNTYPELLDGILQSTGVKISGTEYVSCPTCGRTTFDIQNVLKKVKENTKGLKGVKIAVMGCIVNGPGEMADADYGYVGASPGKVSLYHKGKVVRKNIPEEKALPALLKLINETLAEKQ